MSSNLIQNGDFKQPQLSPNTFNYYTTNAATYWPVPAWFFSSAALINNSTAWGYPTPYPNGNNQAVSIQNMASIFTSINMKSSTTYLLSFWACGRDCCTDSKVNPISIKVFYNYNGREQLSFIYTITPPISKWTQYSFTISTPVTSSCKLYFSGTISYGDHSSAITNVSVVELGSNLIQNGNFTIPQISGIYWKYYTNNNSTDIPMWTFNNAAIANLSSPWGFATPYPNGTQQIAILQAEATIKYPLLLLEANVNYSLGFWICGRNSWNCPSNNPCSGVNPITAKLFTNNNQLESYITWVEPPMGQWKWYTQRFFVTTTQYYYLIFSGTISNGNYASAITNVVLSKDSNIPSSSCNYFMNSTELSCYKDNYPDLSALNNEQLQYQWSNTGCKQNRNNQCPSYQTTVGQYNYMGCFNDSPNRAIPNYRGNNNDKGYSPAECMKLAQANYDSVFGLQYGGECWTGRDINSAKKYGQNFNKNNCPQLGSSWTNQVYYNKNTPPPPPPTPVLSSKNFST
jgi:hypothetical protein